MKQFKDIKYRIGELRTDHDMTQIEFAEFLGISRQSIGFYESGKRVPDASTIRQICEKCDVSADWLLGLPGEKTNRKAEKIIGRAVGLSPETARWLSSEVNGVISAESPLARYASHSISAFLNYAVEYFPKYLQEIEADVHGAIVHDAYDTPDRTQRLKEFLDSKETEEMTMRMFFITNLGADIESVGDKRDKEIDSSVKTFRKVVEEYVSKRGQELRALLARMKESEGSEGNAIDKEEKD